ncbi:hypothetical protein B0H16DRAFT_1801612 [Mycena metata]|uniref:Uncharacterized protein n=1 Tax=Mycena metata TaxID=1033252 RepID=A0AAD7HB61_9AGAR|nr:hypothetical protein B0H16DRAFT_1801612 [Mycena metata]
MFQLIIVHRARWQHLKLFASPRNLGAIIGLFPLLESLTIMTTNGLHPSAYRPATFHSAPLLRRVAIDSYKDIFLHMLPWSQLTVLVFKLIGMSQCLRILVLAPNLVYSDFTFSRLGEGDAPSPQEICIGFPALAINLYSAALPSIVFSSIRRDPLPIHFLDPQLTNLVGLEAMNIDEEGDWDEASSSESEESDSSESGEESTSESGEESTSESGEERRTDVRRTPTSKIRNAVGLAFGHPPVGNSLYAVADSIEYDVSFKAQAEVCATMIILNDHEKNIQRRYFDAFQDVAGVSSLHTQVSPLGDERGPRHLTMLLPGPVSAVVERDHPPNGSWRRYGAYGLFCFPLLNDLAFVP